MPRSFFETTAFRQITGSCLGQPEQNLIETASELAWWQWLAACSKLGRSRGPWGFIQPATLGRISDWVRTIIWMHCRFIGRAARFRNSKTLPRTLTMCWTKKKGWRKKHTFERYNTRGI